MAAANDSTLENVFCFADLTGLLASVEASAAGPADIGSSTDATTLGSGHATGSAAAFAPPETGGFGSGTFPGFVPPPAPRLHPVLARDGRHRRLAALLISELDVAYAVGGASRDAHEAGSRTLASIANRV